MPFFSTEQHFLPEKEKKNTEFCVFTHAVKIWDHLNENFSSY